MELKPTSVAWRKCRRGVSISVIQHMNNTTPAAVKSAIYQELVALYPDQSFTVLCVDGAVSYQADSQRWLTLSIAFHCLEGLCYVPWSRSLSSEVVRSDIRSGAHVRFKQHPTVWLSITVHFKVLCRGQHGTQLLRVHGLTSSCFSLMINNCCRLIKSYLYLDLSLKYYRGIR